MKKIALIGASGYVGSALLNEALKRGLKVTAIVRHPGKITVENPNLTVRAVDVSDPDALAEAVRGSDAVVSAYNPGWNDPHIYEDTLRIYPLIVEAVKKAGAGRLLVVGGAGSLYVEPGVRLMDGGHIPENLMPGVKGLAEVYECVLKPETTLDWVFFSPAADLFPGKRTGKFRLGHDDLIRDAKGRSRISVEDYAAAMIDEALRPEHHRERFTIGY